MKPMTEKLRVDKILSSTGRWSRKEVKDMVRAGRVTAGGVPISSAAEKFDMTADTIEVDGAEISWRKNTYLMMNKPPNVLSATSDRRSQTVLDLLPEDLRRIGLFPAGRLDRDSVGLLLLTDDGELAHNLLFSTKAC
jgi:16S rRNA pseudouridine516 synthase